MIDKIKELFTTSSVSASKDSVQQSNIPPRISEDEKRTNETYSQYGLRICGRVTASLAVLNPFLSRVYHGEKNRQVNDEALQTQYKQQLQQKKNSVDRQINDTKAEISNTEIRIDSINESITDLRQNLVEARNRNGQINKTARLKMIIGLVILTILTVYLFIFYSSTFYSAFFRDFNSEITIGQAIFDSHAIPNALNDGFGEFMFIICAPIIFMGLGYGLHFFMVQKSMKRFLKAGSVLLITFIFDCILAYLIAKKIYDVETLMKLGTYPDFSVAIAVKDINVWAVIFCGFVVYLIWGIVFDMVMTAYDSLRSNRSEIQQIEEKIDGQRNKLTGEQQKLSQCKSQLATFENESSSLEKEMNRNVHFDIQIIRTALADFFAGWMSMMTALDKAQVEQTQANNIYQETITVLFPNN